MAMTEALDPTEVHELEAQCEWTRESLATDYIWQLSDDERAELHDALQYAKERTTGVLEITSELFPLPTMGAKLVDLAHDLISGRGVALIRGLDRDRYSALDASAIYFGVGVHLGKPWPQNAKGHLLGDVTDQGKRGDDPTSRGNELGGVGLPFHSDGSDLVGLFCLDAGADGGDSLVANAVRVHNELARIEPELAAELYAEFAYDYRGEQGEGRRAWYTMPVFTRRDDRLFVRYIRPYIISARRHADAPRPSAKAEEAMSRVDALCAEPENHVSMRLQPGDMQFINNYHVLHGRAPYEDDRDHGRVRYLKRLWLETSVFAPDEKPEQFRMNQSATSWWGAVGKGPSWADAAAS